MKKGIVVVISGLVAFFSAEKIYAQTASGTLSKDTAKIKSSAPDEYEQILQKKRETSNNAAEQTPVKKDTIRKVVVVKSNNPQVVPAGSVVIKKPVLIKENYVGFNTAPMLNQFVPFNALDPSKQLVSVNFRRYTNNKGYRLGLGSNLEVDGDIQSFAFKYDVDKRRQISQKMLYNLGYGFGFEYFEDLTEGNGFFFGINGFADAIFAIHWGVEYQINPMISLSTEASWQLRLGTTGGMRIVPPLAIIANIKVDKLMK
jgi:hypothetical protein